MELPNPHTNKRFMFHRTRILLTSLALSICLLSTPLCGQDWLINNNTFTTKVVKQGKDLLLTNGIVTRKFRITPNLCTTSISTSALSGISTPQNLVRAVRPEAMLTLDGKTYSVGGLIGQPNHAFLKQQWLENMKADPNGFAFLEYTVTEPKERMSWKRVRRHAQDVAWPPNGKRVEFKFVHQQLPQIKVSVFYELYDGIPCFCKWVEVENLGEQPVTVDRLTTEILALVEKNNWVEARDGVTIPRPDSIHVETDFSFGGFNFPNANRHVVHWEKDPQYSTQVNYLRQTPCLLKVSPTYGPAQTIQPQSTFKSYHTFELVHDSSDEERKNLSLRKMYRVIAPWVTENPIMLHLKASNFDLVKRAIDQCKQVGFEMVILSFGSGFNIESRDESYISKWNEVNEYANKAGIELGGYSLLSSRRIGGGNDVVTPQGIKPTHGNCPALTSKWGQEYFQKLYDFFEKTGFRLLEHDGSYPGDVDTTERLPFQKGEQDSRWAQWQVISKFYSWCRARGIYLNVPDYYYLSGSNKCGMGYREVNWSLPREHQVLHTRQNIFDGTRWKTPSMGWMFVPLTQYHGGGAAATVEPLHEHLDHYERMMASNFGCGVQACYRGPRIFDTDATKAKVKQWVDWYKQYREILEADIIHSSSRRADGQDLDWVLHAHPGHEQCGMLMVYNPLDEEVTKRIPLNLYYTGVESDFTFSEVTPVEKADSKAKVTSQKLKVDRQYRCFVEVTIPANGVRAYVMEKSKSEAK